ncbi:MAG: aminomethyl transferase family protein [Candidatus Rokubacteria bacterium]|nr:aminomethyl transferase family protein [Candidatus Rokubacteria bacterium]
MLTLLPGDFGDAAAEYAAVRKGTGLIDRRDWGVVEVTGRDRATFLHALLSNEVKALAPGQGCAATLLDVHGKVQVVLFVWVLDDRILLVTPPSMAPKVVEALDHYLFSEKASLRDATEETALLLLAGSGAPATVERLAGARPADAPWSHAAATIDGTPVRLVTGGAETGEREVWIVAAVGEGGRLWDRLVAAGARPVGLTALESLRIEAGTPRYGHDVDETVLLPEIPSANLLSHTKGCYPGQEVVVRIRDRGHVNRLLAGLMLEGDAVPERGAAVLAGEAEIGRVTSATRSFGLGRPIALAFVRRQHAEPGTVVTVRAGGRTIAARVAALPFSRS